MLHWWSTFFVGMGINKHGCRETTCRRGPARPALYPYHTLTYSTHTDGTVYLARRRRSALLRNRSISATPACTSYHLTLTLHPTSTPQNIWLQRVFSGKCCTLRYYMTLKIQKRPQG